MSGPSDATDSSGAKRPPAPFIVGVGRSGTTLLRMMLDAHPVLAVTPETHFAPAAGAFDRGGPSAAVEAMVGDGLWDDYGLPAEDLARRVAARRDATFGDVLRCFYELYAERRGKPQWGDKTPDYLTVMAAVQEHLPEARFIHVVRDGRDVALSMARLWFGADDVVGVARMWSRRLAEARRQAADLRFYTEVRYEDLVRDPPTVLGRVCGFLGLEWDPAMLDYHRGAGERLAAESPPVHQEGRRVSREERLEIHRLTAEPPRTDRAERWRREMSAPDLSAFERIAGETLESFGYRLSRSRGEVAGSAAIGRSMSGAEPQAAIRPKVFCIGFHKTGTTSMGVALETFGYRVAGPFGVNDPDIRHRALPVALETGKRFDAAQDNPWPLLYAELDRRFPGSRFVLTVRDPSRWIGSVVGHFGEESTPMREWIYGAGSPLGNEDAYVERFERHERDVREYFAGRDEDLLVMSLEAGDGWRRLCAFLGLDPPSRPFPHVNKGFRRDNHRLNSGQHARSR